MTLLVAVWLAWASLGLLCVIPGPHGSPVTAWPWPRFLRMVALAMVLGGGLFVWTIARRRR
jgi:hypothetical protein